MDIKKTSLTEYTKSEAMIDKCNCPYCAGNCQVIDEYSEEGGTCEFCFREHTYFDEEDDVYYPIRKGLTA